MPPAHLITGVYYKKKGNSVVTATKGKEMEHLEEFLRGTALFKGVPGEGMARLLRHLQGAVHTYEKQQDVLHEGQHALPRALWCPAISRSYGGTLRETEISWLISEQAISSQKPMPAQERHIFP